MKCTYRFKAVGAVLVLLALAGCRTFSPSAHGESGSGSPAPPLSSARTAIASMPRVTATDLDATGRILTSAGLTVVVKRPELEVPSRAPERKPFMLPEIVRPFQPSQWNHMIEEQHPPAGTPLGPGSVITLTAGIHHGAGPFRPWLDAHGGSVSRRGEQRCRDCHTPKYCTDCHENL